MYLDEIKRGLRAEIKKRENEQYFTFQTNIRQMCKDVLSKLEEQESEIAEKDKEIARLDDLTHAHNIELLRKENLIAELKSLKQALMADDLRYRYRIRRHKYKRCLAMADKCVDLCHKAKDLYRWAEDENLEHHYNRKIEFFARWHKRWLTLADKYK